jgi:endonuclease YncB( thermonuclease family)
MAVTFVAGAVAGLTLGPVMNGRMLPANAAAASPVSADGVSGRRLAYPVEVLRVIDGDTFNARVRVWPGVEIVTKVRLRNIDAPEHRARCDRERIGAQAAHDALVRLLAEGDVFVTEVALGKYGGRVLARVSTRHTSDVSTALLEAGLVRRYSGGRRGNWC